MSTRLPLDERIEVAAQLVKRARIFYDIWWFYEGADTRPGILNAMNKYSEFFRFDSHAHFVALVVHLASLFESRSSTVNFPTLVREAKDSGVIAPEAITKAEGILAEGQELPPKVAILRSNLFAHRSASLSFDEAFGKASITGNQLRDVTVTGLCVANVLLAARNLPEQFFHELSKHDAESLLNDLAKVYTT